jgi:hypothetical protein
MNAKPIAGIIRGQPDGCQADCARFHKESGLAGGVASAGIWPGHSRCAIILPALGTVPIHHAPVAQGIERLVADQKVGGSNPSGRTSGTTVDDRGFLMSCTPRANAAPAMVRSVSVSDILADGEVSEWLMVPISKIGVV